MVEFDQAGISGYWRLLSYRIMTSQVCADMKCSGDYLLEILLIDYIEYNTSR